MASNLDPAKIQIIESTMAKYPLDEFRKVSRLIDEQQIDLIHTHMTRGQNFGIGLKLITGTPVIATAHNRHLEFHWKFNDYVIANSKSTFDYHARYNRISARRMKTIYCCPDYSRIADVQPHESNEIRNRLKLQPRDFLIGLVGEVAVRKGHIHLVRALPEILRHVPSAKVMFVGRFGRQQNHVRQIRKFILQNGLAGRVKWMGRQSNVAPYMAASQVMVVPSIEEPLGLVAIESLMAGTPVVASDTGGLGEIIASEETGLLVPVGDEAKLAEQVIRLAHQPGLREYLVANGRQHVEETFSAAPLIDQVEDVYHRVLKTASGSATSRAAA